MRIGLRIGLTALLLLMETPAVFSEGTVSTCTEAALREALIGGGRVDFACDGTIALSSPLLITNATELDGTGHAIVLSGNQAVRIIHVAHGAQLILTNLTLANGTNSRGAALFSEGTEVICAGCAFEGNIAQGTNGLDGAHGEPAAGGAIWSGGPLTLVDCGFGTNRAAGGAGSGGNGRGGDATGGAIYCEGFLTLSNVSFVSNAAIGGSSGRGDTGWGLHGANASGGAIHGSGGLAGWDCRFEGNAVIGGYTAAWRAHRGAGRGGAVAVAGGDAHLWRGWFESNSVGGSSGFGGALWHGGMSLLISNATVRGNTAGGDRLSGYLDAEGGPGAGGGLYSQAHCVVVDSIFEGNRCNGGPANMLPVPPSTSIPGGPAHGGGVFSSGALVVEQCTIVSNSALGGEGIDVGGSVFGAGVCVTEGSASLVNVTICSNTAVGGPPHSEIGVRAGSAAGGGFCLTNGMAGLTNGTVWGNAATGVPYPGFDRLPGEEKGGGVANLSATNLLLRNSIVAGSTSGGDVFGNTTGDHNLIAADPMVLPLADYGGLTPTLALLPASPAVDAADPTGAPATDQRGVPRPFGPAPDIGAFEWNGTIQTNFVIQTLVITNGLWKLKVQGPPNRYCRLVASANLTAWFGVCTNYSGSEGLFWADDPANPPPPARFYRIISP